MASMNRSRGNVLPGLRLFADIGGTNARFALARRGRNPYAFDVLKTKDFRGPAQAITAYLRRKALGRRPESAVIAVGGPVCGDQIKFTNAPWAFSISDLHRASAIDDIFVLNDFEALAWALPALSAADVRKFGRGRRDSIAPRVVFGPGTGLGPGVWAGSPFEAPGER